MKIVEIRISMDNQTGVCGRTLSQWTQAGERYTVQRPFDDFILYSAEYVSEISFTFRFFLE